MSNDVYSNAFNFQSNQSGKVDLRTGQYSARIHLTTLRPEGGGGDGKGGEAKREVALTFSMMKAGNDGYGIGWSLGISEFDLKTSQLRLATGERFQGDPLPPPGNLLSFRDKKLRNIEVRRSDADTLLILSSEGTTETLTRPVAGGPYKTTGLSFANSERFVFEYTSGGWLSRIRNATTGTEFLSLSYGGGGPSRARSVASAGRVAEIAFTVVNNLIQRVTVPYDNTGGTANPGTQAVFVYQYLRFAAGYYGITRIDNPMGGSETIAYQERGHSYYNGAYLPFVTRWERIPAAGQPSSVRRYAYSPTTNFTGYPYSGGFTAGTDNLYRVSGTYEYWSEESVVDSNAGNAVMSSTRTAFNKFHLTTSTVVRQGEATTTTAMLYNDVPGKPFSEQPANLQLVRETTVTYATASSGARSEKTRIETDEFGNDLSRLEPTGIMTQWDYYPVGGESGRCPADPLGLFVRFRKRERIVPAGSGSVRQTDFQYLQFPRLGNGYLVLPRTSTTSADVTTSATYLDDPSKPTLHGRIRTQDVAIGGRTTTCQYAYQAGSADVTETCTTIGHDGTRSDTVHRYCPAVDLTLEVRKSDGVAIRYDYDVMGRVTAETAAPGTASAAARHYEYSYAAQGVQARVTVTDAGGNRFVSRFDGLGREVSAAQLVGGTTERRMRATVYDRFERKASDTVFDQVDGTELTLVTSYAYDDWNQVARTTNPDGSVSLSRRDPVGNTLTTGVQGLNTTVNSYNAFNQVASVTQVGRSGSRLQTLTRRYDGFGRCVGVTDVDGHVTEYDYDAFDRVSVTRARPADGTAARTTTVTYAPHTSAELVASMAVNGITLGSRAYDGLGRLLSESRAGMAASTFAYDGGATRPSRKVTPANVTLTYRYDAAIDAVTAVSRQQQSVNDFQYDPVSGQPLRAHNAAATRSYGYDGQGYPTTETVTLGGASSVCRYTHSPAGRLLRTEAPSGDIEVRRYDSAGRVREIVNGSATIQQTYDAFGRLAGNQVTQDGTTIATTVEYDDFGREQTRTFRLGGAVLSSVQRGYHPNGTLANRTTRDGANAILSQETFAYDAYSRLLVYGCSGSRFPSDSLGREIAQQSFRLDALDNITSVVTRFRDGTVNTSTRVYNPAIPSQLQRIDDSLPAAQRVLKYDANGNLIDDGAGRTFAYDDFNHLTDCSRSGSYLYDAEGRLIRQAIPDAQPLDLHYASGSLAEESQGTASVRYRRDKEAVRGRTRRTSGGSPAESELYAVDPSGSVAAAVEAGDRVLGRMYTPYGESGQPGVNPATPLIERQRIAFNGERFDAMANLYHLGHGRRAYSPELMMFLTPDPLAPFSGGGFSCYAYCKGDPINRADPSGLLSSLWNLIISVAALVAAIVIAVVAVAAAVPTGGASLFSMAGAFALFNAAGAITGLAGATLGVASAAMTVDDERTGQHREGTIRTLGIISTILGAAAMVMSVGAGVWKGLLTSQKFSPYLTRGARFFSRPAAGDYAPLVRFSSTAGDVVQIGPMSGGQLLGRSALSGMGQLLGYDKAAILAVTGFANFGLGATTLALGIVDIVGAGSGADTGGANGNGQRETPLDNGSTPSSASAQPYQPVTGRYEDTITRNGSFNTEFRKQAEEIRGPFSRQLYYGRQG